MENIPLRKPPIVDVERLPKDFVKRKVILKKKSGVGLSSSKTKEIGVFDIFDKDCPNVSTT